MKLKFDYARHLIRKKEFSCTRQILNWVPYGSITKKGRPATRSSANLVNTASTLWKRSGMEKDWGGLCPEMGDVTLGVERGISIINVVNISNIINVYVNNIIICVCSVTKAVSYSFYSRKEGNASSYKNMKFQRCKYHTGITNSY